VSIYLINDENKHIPGAGAKGLPLLQRLCLWELEIIQNLLV
jgi:hypothetical protein